MRRAAIAPIAVLALAGCSTETRVCSLPDGAAPLAIGGWGTEVLPTGQCAKEGDTCSREAATRCGDSGQSAGYSVYQCVCETGSWRCNVVYAGASKCVDRDL